MRRLVAESFANAENIPRPVLRMPIVFLSYSDHRQGCTPSQMQVGRRCKARGGPIRVIVHSSVLTIDVITAHSNFEIGGCAK